MNKLPLARTQDLVMQDLGNEILLYDLKLDKAFCLNETASIVFRHCDGSTSPTDLKLKKDDLSDEVIFLTLDLLENENLLKVKDYRSHFDGLSRREIIKKVGLASMIVLPVISSIIAPQAAAAQSGDCFNQPCVFSDYSQGSCCNSNFRCYNHSACTFCFVTGEMILFAAPAADDAFCNAQINKNVCCNPGPVTGDGSWCYCP